MPSSVQAPTDLIRPYLWLALTTFLIGFVLTLATGVGHVAAVRAQAAREMPDLRPAVDLRDIPDAAAKAI